MTKINERFFSHLHSATKLIFQYIHFIQPIFITTNLIFMLIFSLINIAQIT